MFTRNVSGGREANTIIVFSVFITANILTVLLLIFPLSARPKFLIGSGKMAGYYLD